MVSVQRREKLQRRLINNYVKRQYSSSSQQRIKLHIYIYVCVPAYIVYIYIYAVCVWALLVRSVGRSLFFFIFFCFISSFPSSTSSLLRLFRFCFVLLLFHLLLRVCVCVMCTRFAISPLSLIVHATTWDYCYNLGSEIINSFFFSFFFFSSAAVAAAAAVAVAVADVVGVCTLFNFFLTLFCFSAFFWALSFDATSTAGQYVYMYVVVYTLICAAALTLERQANAKQSYIIIIIIKWNRKTNTSHNTNIHNT